MNIRKNMKLAIFCGIVSAFFSVVLITYLRHLGYFNFGLLNSLKPTQEFMLFSLDFMVFFFFSGGEVIYLLYKAKDFCHLCELHGVSYWKYQIDHLKVNLGMSYVILAIWAIGSFWLPAIASFFVPLSLITVIPFTVIVLILMQGYPKKISV